MISRRILRTSLAVLLCLVAIPVFVGCGDKTTAPVVTATGGCCVGSNCMVLTSANCAQNGGTYKGDNVSCATNPCVSQTTGTITGTASLPAGTPGSITNSLVSIYASYDDWNNYRSVRYVASTTIDDAHISFTFSNITPGTYYLDVWKDNDLSGRWTNGDFLGVYGSFAWPTFTLSPLMVAAGQTASVSVTLVAINWY